MTDADKEPKDPEAALAQFLAAHEPPEHDAHFLALTLAAQRRRHASGQMWQTLGLWAGGATLVALVGYFAGDLLTNALAPLTPVAAPIAIVGTVLFMMRRALAPARLR